MDLYVGRYGLSLLNNGDAYIRRNGYRRNPTSCTTSDDTAGRRVYLLLLLRVYDRKEQHTDYNEADHKLLTHLFKQETSPC